MPSTVLSNNNFYVPNLWMEHEPPTNQLKFNSWWCSNMFSAHPFKKHPKTGSLSQLRRKGYYRIQKNKWNTETSNQSMKPKSVDEIHRWFLHRHRHVIHCFFDAGMFTNCDQHVSFSGNRLERST